MKKETNNLNELTRIVEGILFAASAPLSVETIGKYFAEEEKPKSEAIRKVLSLLQTQYQDRGIRLVEVASGYRFQVADEVSPYIAKNLEEKPARFSRALLETLALIAYRQPITRGEIEDIRGVVVSTNIIKTLDELNWIRVVGHKDVPGKPALFATTKGFLDYFGLKSLEDLPPLAELQDFESLSASPLQEAPENEKGQLELDMTENQAEELCGPLPLQSENELNDEENLSQQEGSAPLEIMDESEEDEDPCHDSDLIETQEEISHDTIA